MGWLNISLWMGTQPSALEAAPLGDGGHHCQEWLLQWDDVVQAQGTRLTSFVCWDKGQSSRISPKLGITNLSGNCAHPLHPTTVFVLTFKWRQNLKVKKGHILDSKSPFPAERLG